MTIENKEPYLQVDPDFADILDSLHGRNGAVNYFSYADELKGVDGIILNITRSNDGEFLNVGADQKIRLDRIITVLGKPGPSFEKYNHYANACFSCFDEGQF